MKRIDIIMNNLDNRFNKKQRTNQGAIDGSISRSHIILAQPENKSHSDSENNRQDDSPNSSPLREMSPETKKIYETLSNDIENHNTTTLSSSPSTLAGLEAEFRNESELLEFCQQQSNQASKYENIERKDNFQDIEITEEIDNEDIIESSPQLANFVSDNIYQFLPSNLSIPPPSFSPLTPLVRRENNPETLDTPGKERDNNSNNLEDYFNDSDDSVRDPNYVNDCLVQESDDKNSDASEEKEENKRRPKKGRPLKHKYNRNEQKNRKYQNLSYYSKNKKIEPKIFKNYKCSCSKKCANLVSSEIREQEFNKFVHLGSYVAQLLYITSCVSETKKKRSYTTVSSPSKSKPREFTRTYKINGTSVCRDMFCKTLQIAPQKITVCLRKIRDGTTVKDKRGEKAGGWKRLEKAHFDFIVNIIKKLPAYESHYRREKNSDVLYLQPGMTVPKIYELYKSEFQNQYGAEAKCASFNTLRKIFVDNFNLRCKSLKKDTCNKCDSLTTKLNSLSNSEQREQVKLEKDKHLEIAEKLRNKMKEDFEKAKVCKEIECLSFDLEKTLPLPRIPTNGIFYKRQLWVYNCGVHSASDDKGHCYVWAEGEAGRGAQEVASCLIKYIKNNLPSEVTNLIFWSDCCGGQNRNIKIVLMLKAIINSHPNLETISFRYLESGHTFLPNDSDFSKIETRLKQHQRIYTVNEYMDVIKFCKKVNPLEVYRMKNSDFLGSMNLEKRIVNRKTFTDKTKVNWLKTKEIVIKKTVPYSLFMRTSFEEELKEVIIQKKIKNLTLELTDTYLRSLWPTGKPINQNKLNDLKSILHLIPDDCIEYYKSLKGSDTVTDDVDGYGAVDFEIENEDA